MASEIGAFGPDVTALIYEYLTDPKEIQKAGEYFGYVGKVAPYVQKHLPRFAAPARNSSYFQGSDELPFQELVSLMGRKSVCSGKRRASVPKPFYFVKEDWRFEGGKQHSDPVIDQEGKIYFGSMEGLTCYDLKNRNSKLLFFYPTDGDVGWPHSLIIDESDGKIYVGSENGTLYCFDPRRDDFFKDPKPLWSFPLEAKGDPSLSIGLDGKIYFVCNHLYFFDPKEKDAKPSKLFSDVFSEKKPVLVDHAGRIYIGDSYLSCYDPKEGKKPLWTIESVSQRGTPFIQPDGKIYVGTSDGCFCCYDSFAAKIPELLWSQKVVGNVSGIAFSNKKIYVTTEKKCLYCFDKEKKKLLWQKQNNSPYPPAVGADGKVYVTFGRNLYYFDPNPKLLWRGQSELRMQGLGPDGTIYILEGNDLVALKPVTATLSS